jgi:type VI secretion system secreted protein Hcp
MADAMDGYIQIGDIKGECAEDKHKEWINIRDLKFGVNLPIIGFKSEGEANISDRGNFYDIYFGKGVDKTTPKLLEAVAKATLFEKVIIEMCQTLNNVHDVFLKLTLEKVYITSVRDSLAGGSIMSESVGLNFGKMTMTCKPLDMESGKFGGQIEKIWDRATLQAK